MKIQSLTRNQNNLLLDKTNLGPIQSQILLKMNYIQALLLPTLFGEIKLKCSHISDRLRFAVV